MGEPHLNGLSAGLFAECLSLTSLCIIFTAVRFWAAAVVPSKETGRRFHADDWFCLAAVVCLQSTDHLLIANGIRSFNSPRLELTTIGYFTA
jgi:hypothetical protein